MIELRGAAGRTLSVPGSAVYGIYRPAGGLEYVIVNDRSLIHFGFTGAFGKILLDSASGVVVENHQDSPDVALVNTSLDAFGCCLKEFSAKFPLDEIDDEDEADGRDSEVAQEIEEDMLRIDPEAYTVNSFWYEIRWSVAIGDFRDWAPL